MINLARTTQDNRQQLLSEHLFQVAKLTAESLPESLREIGWYAGLWHDLGKYIPQWQQYLRGKASKIPHSAQGALLALSLGDDPDTIPAIATVIAGHHVGLQSTGKIESRSFEKLGENWQAALELAQQEISDFLPAQIPDIDWQPLRRELAIRMLFSALVDADRLDAMNFELKLKNPCTARVFVLSEKCFNPRSLVAARSSIDQIRNDFTRYCIQAAPQPKGLYRLTGACGIGKTQASLRFATIHADAHNMSGIIYVGPLKSIIEQTAQVYRQLLGSEIVLEHHSGFEPEETESANYKLDTERWDKAIVVTSGVQFYESLFSDRPSKCRKLHNIANRVILIDEAQTVPLHLAIPILDVLETLVKDWGCTIVLMSATQPAFDRLGLCDSATDIVPFETVQEQFQVLERVTYRVESQPWTWETLAEDVNKSGLKQSLTVVNTTALAREGYQTLHELVSGDWFHLSARMCPAHRQEVLAEIRHRLENGLPCHLISTQLIEAGVDVDFPRAYRQLGPLDSIIQTAGRCNRNNKLRREDSILTVFNLQGTQIFSPDYRYRTDITRGILIDDPDALTSNLLKTIRVYFKSVYNQIRAGGKEIQEFRYQYNFPEVAKLAKVIDDEQQVSVVVPWKEGADLIQRLGTQTFITQDNWRKLQAYTVSLPHEDGAVATYDNGLKVWTGGYSDYYGLFNQK